MEKNEIIKLPLHEILKNNGWWIKKNKSTATSKTLTNDYDDLVVVSKLKNDDYVYFKPNSSDRGKENVYQTQISTVSEVNDFYKQTSFDGAMDPKGMRFDGIGCLRKENKDTVFYISCHIDRSKINRIINHSKFELVLDTLIISPTHSNLPNSSLDIPFSFEERKNFTLSMNIKLLSSWMNEIVQLQKNQELGEFSINIPVDQSVLDNKGYLRYVRNANDAPAYKVLGESFIVPRSYMGYRDENDNYKNSWGTGEYKLDITLKETCDVTEQYRKKWKEDRKRRKGMQPKENFFASSWQTISNQRWDELTKSWVITTLKAPASIITKEIGRAHV